MECFKHRYNLSHQHSNLNKRYLIDIVPNVTCNYYFD